ncbi:MAG TPA: hypothetical protein VGD77_01145 [Gemmatimonadaceae bacterium]|jgi:hypothetical protein
MRFKISSTIALGVALALAVDASTATAQDTTRTTRRSSVRIPVSKEPAAPCVCDTVRITRVDTVTMWRRDTVTVTREVQAPAPAPVIAPVVAKTWGKGFYWGVGGGVSLPQRDFGNYDNGWNATGMVGVDPVSYPLGWRFDVSYDKWGRPAWLENTTPDKPSHFAANLDLKLRIPVFSRVAVYALGGATYAMYKNVLAGPEVQPNAQGTIGVNGSTVTFGGVANPSYTYYDSWKSNFGWNGGGGVSFGLGEKIDLFFESRMIADKTNTDKGFVPIIGGFTWSF